MNFTIALWISKLAAKVVSIVDKNRGTNYSGALATRLMPNFISGFKGIDYNKVIFITGTNGKSTTTNLVYRTLLSAGKTAACNTEGANMMAGVATTLIKNSSITGKFNKDFLVLEVDERSLPGIRRVLPAGHMGITNLEKDQNQRNGDPDFIYSMFEKAIGKDMTLYLNNEEPRSSALAEKAGRAVFFSVDKNDRAFNWETPYQVTQPCALCSHPIKFDGFNLAGIGPFSCTHCNHKSKENPEVRISNIDFDKGSFDCGGFKYTVGYTDPFYIYNFALVISLGKAIGLTDQELVHALETFVSPVSHYQVFRYQGKEIRYLQGKQENPEALQTQLDIISMDPRHKVVAVGMCKVNNFDPYYAGTFYLYDCNFEDIVKGDIARYIAFSETVCYDIASRLVYAGADEEKITVMDDEDPSHILDALTEIDAEVIYVLSNLYSYNTISGYLLSHGGTQDA